MPRSTRSFIGRLKDAFFPASSAREAFLRQAQEVGQIGTWVSGLRDGDKLQWSDETYRIFGFQPQTFDGKVETFFSVVHPDDRERVRRASQAAIQDGVPYNIDHRIVRPDGVVRWVHERADVVRDLEGRPQSMVGVVQDVTERKRTEHDLVEAKRFAESLLETANVMIVQVDAAGRIQTINQMAEIVSGRSKTEMHGQPWSALAGDTAQKSPPPKIFEARLVTRVGEERWISWVTNDVRQDGRLVGRIAFGIDITGRRQAEEQLRASLHEKEVLLREVHHRVKNNLQVISSLLSLQSGHLKDSPAAALFKESQDRIKSMALVHERLYQSKNLARVGAADYIRNLTAHLVRSYKVESAVACRVEADDTLLHVDTAIACGLILNELVSNALKHAFPGRPAGAPPAEVVVTLSRQGSRIRLTVRDNGRGLPEGLDLATAPTLGMRLVRSLTAQLGGELELERRGGAGFRLTFEERAPEPARPPAAAAARER